MPRTQEGTTRQDALGHLASINTRTGLVCAVNDLRWAFRAGIVMNGSKMP
jgi:hypothetical protein